MPIVIGFAVNAAVVVFSWRGNCVCDVSFCAFVQVRQFENQQFIYKPVPTKYLANEFVNCDFS